MQISGGYRQISWRVLREICKAFGVYGPVPGGILLLPWGLLWEVLEVLGDYWPTLGNILGRLPWRVGVKSVQSARWILAKSWAPSSAIALGSAWGGFAKSLGKLGQILGTFLRDCLGESSGESFNVLGVIVA